MLIASEQDLFKACRTLFDIENDISRDFLEYLQLSGIKSAYRKKALETHPDRAAFYDKDNNLNGKDLFHSIQQAYEHLTAYLKARDKGFRFKNSQTNRPHIFSSAREQSSHHPENAASFYASSAYADEQQQAAIHETENYYTGDIPERNLLFGHYLYYAGYINWRIIIQALIWQRAQRPRLGELASRYGWFTEQDIIATLKNRTLSQPFGQTALQLGLLDEMQLKVLLYQQNRLQKKIGSYFVENKLLTQKQLDDLVLHHQEHNARFNQKSSNLF